jgi:hypothetical protein
MVLPFFPALYLLCFVFYFAKRLFTGATHPHFIAHVPVAMVVGGEAVSPLISSRVEPVRYTLIRNTINCMVQLYTFQRPKPRNT